MFCRSILVWNFNVFEFEDVVDTPKVSKSKRAGVAKIVKINLIRNYCA